MSQSREPDDGSQRSVAELIARYGEPTAAGRRRRRREPDAEDTAPQSIIDRVGADRVVASQEERAGRRRDPDDAPSPFAPSRPVPYQSSPEPAPWSSGARAAGWPRDDYGNDYGDDHRQKYRDDEESRFGRPLVGQDSFAHSEDAGPRTEQLPVVGAVVRDPAPNVVPLRAPDRSAGGGPPAGLDSRTRPAPPAGRPQPEPTRTFVAAGTAARDTTGADDVDHAERDYGDEEFDDYAHADHADHEGDVDHEGDEGDEVPASSPVREWAVVASQVGAGVVGGAMLWLVSEWLWQSIPLVALAVALAVITGLVWVVRRVRRAEDLQTTVIAVLVGLFVTVSPAALLLVGR